MKFITICSLLLVFCAVVGLVPTALATPSRDSGGNSWRGGSPGSGRIQNRPFIYDAPIRRPGQPETSFHENFGELMERLLNSLCRTTPRILQLQRSQFQQNVKYYRINDDRAALKQIQKQLGFLKSKAIDERHQLDEKIAELQKRIERVKRKMRQVDKKSKKSEK